MFILEPPIEISPPIYAIKGFWASVEIQVLDKCLPEDANWQSIKLIIEYLDDQENHMQFRTRHIDRTTFDTWDLALEPEDAEDLFKDMLEMFTDPPQDCNTCALQCDAALVKMGEKLGSVPFYRIWEREL